METVDIMLKLIFYISTAFNVYLLFQIFKLFDEIKKGTRKIK